MGDMAIIYWSQTGNTEAMAGAVAEGARAAGARVRLLTVSECAGDEWRSCDLLALGCPAMGGEVLEEEAFEPFFQAVEGGLSGKKLALFGSYGWGDGRWMRDWWDRCGRAGALRYGGEGLILKGAPSAAGLDRCRAFGGGFASF